MDYVKLILDDLISISFQIILGRSYKIILYAIIVSFTNYNFQFGIDVTFF
jgi:hypothetical protein